MAKRTGLFFLFVLLLFMIRKTTFQANAHKGECAMGERETRNNLMECHEFPMKFRFKCLISLITQANILAI